MVLLRDLEQSRKRAEEIRRLGAEIGGAIQKETEGLKGHFDQFTHSILRLEQEMREM